VLPLLFLQLDLIFVLQMSYRGPFLDFYFKLSVVQTVVVRHLQM